MNVLLKFTLAALFLVMLQSYKGWSQGNPCTTNTPIYVVDLTGNPDSLWVSSPPIVRAGSCCGSNWPDRCIVFLLTLDTATVAINFEIIDGASPSGALFYQIDCGPITPVGDPLCLTGPGPYWLTFCKPGSNLNTYGITAIGGPVGAPDDTTGIGCSTMLSIAGVDPATVTWNDITGGGIYNSYLSCTSGCDTTTVSPDSLAPPFIDYEVCGDPAAGACLPPDPFCDTIRVYIMPELIVDATPDTPVFCTNSFGVQLYGSATGGNGNYLYTWTDDNGNVLANTMDYYATSAGTYILIVQDGFFPDCPFKSDTVVVTEQGVPYSSAGADINICADITSISLNGSVVNATGGIWTGGSGTFSPDDTSLNTTYTPSPAEIANGGLTLTLTPTGTNGCTPAIDYIIISISPAIILTIDAPPIICTGNSVIITAQTSGGLPPLTYFWNTGDTTQSITATPGTYFVSVSDASVFQCLATATVTIAQNPSIDVIASPDTSIDCDTITDIWANASGGSGVYTYLWSTGQTDSIITVTPGTFQVTVSDGSGCIAVDTVVIDPINSNLEVSIAEPGVLCFGATTTLTAVASNGIGFYSYLWSTGETLPSITVGAGSYCVVVTDLIGCWITTCVIIEEDSLLMVNISSPPLTCNGELIPLTASASGGEQPYSYLWSNGLTTSSVLLSAGTYTVMVTDANACINTASISISNEPAINVTLTSTPLTCNNAYDGSIVSSVSGGISPYTYLWMSLVSDSATALNLAAGTYAVTVSDSMGCSGVASIGVTEPDLLIASIASTTNPSCNGSGNGDATVNTSGGTPTYTYQWSPAGGNGSVGTGLSQGVYTVTVTDTNGCSDTAVAILVDVPPLFTSTSYTEVSCTGGSDGTAAISASGGTSPFTYVWSPNVSSGTNASGLTAGTYFITVSDNQGCTIIDSVVVSQVPNLLVVSANVMNASCFGSSDGQATASVTGGTPVYSFSWSPSGGTDSIITGLATGSTTVTVTDALGCQASMTVNISEPSALSLVTIDQNILCTSTVTLNFGLSGGTTPYTYLWSTGETTVIIFSNTPGIYTIQVTDNNGCTVMDTVEVIATNSTLAATIDVPGNFCNGTTTTITAIPTAGGGGGYSYAWSTGDTTVSITIGAGLYCITVTDGVGCQVTSCVTVVSDDSLIIDITPDQICANSIANITAVVLGGAAPYSFLWSTGDTTQSITDSAGTYTVTVSDSIGCVAILTETVVENPEMQISFSNVYHVSCIGDSNGAVVVNVDVGVSPYTFIWSPGGYTEPDYYGLSAGTYFVTVSDSVGCSVEDSITIIEPGTPMVLDSIAGTNLTCFGLNTGSATVVGSGGDPPYNYLWWSLNDTSATVDSLPAGTYFVSVADTNGCIASTSVTITQPPLIEVIVDSVLDVSCNGYDDGTTSVQTTGGIPAYSFLWSNGSNNDSLTDLAAGVYSLTVTDASGCLDSLTVTITEPASIIASASGSATICSGQSTTITVVTTGGSGFYNYEWVPNLGNAASYIVSPTVTTPYQVAVTDTNGCIDTSDVILVTVYGPLSVVVGSSDTICEGSTGTVFATATGGDGNYSYFWSDSTFGNSAGPFTVSPPVTSLYTVLVTDGCGSPPASTSSSIIVSPLPSLTISTNPPAGCVVLQVTFSADTAGNPPGTTYQWEIGGNNFTGSTMDQVFTVSGTYVVTLTATTPFGCSASTTNNGSVTVFPAAVAGFIADPAVTSIFSPIIDFYDASSSDVTWWQWYFGDGDSLIGQFPDTSHTYGDTGIYEVMLVVNNQYGCPDTIIQYVEIKPDYAFFIPNAFTPNDKGPNNTFTGYGYCITQFEMYIFNRWGDKIYHSENYNEPWDGHGNNGKKMAQQDVYVYLIYVWDCLGERHDYIGHVTLIR